MTEDALRAYALRGLNARLVELDLERARIVELLGEWNRPRRAPSTSSSSPLVESKKQTPPPQELEPRVALEAPVQSPVPSGVEEARILPPRRRQLPRGHAAAVPMPSLPPMPRLVKANAS